jgi:hypothetical protein
MHAKSAYLQTTIIPKIFYGVEIWCLNSEGVNLLDSWLRSVLYRILNIRRRDRISLATILSSLKTKGIIILPFRFLIAQR